MTLDIITKQELIYGTSQLSYKSEVTLIFSNKIVTLITVKFPVRQRPVSLSGNGQLIMISEFSMHMISVSIVFAAVLLMFPYTIWK